MSLRLERVGCLCASDPSAFAGAVRAGGVESVGSTALGRAVVLLLLLVLLTSMPFAVRAETPVSGSITTDTHWTLSESPYVVTGELLVQNGATLTIDPAVLVYMEAGASLNVQTGGIVANGEADRRIEVLSVKSLRGLTPVPGDYGTWTFGPGTQASTRLEHVSFRHGRGLVVLGAAPLFNHLDIRQSLGPAIRIDLAASPRGVGNVASGNDLNGIAVPSGDVLGSVNWGLRGIPYVVESGTVSVGRSPVVNAVSPASVERGATVSLAIDGVRLGDLSSAKVDKAGVEITPISGGSTTRQSFQLKADSDAELGPATLVLTVAAGEILIPDAFQVTQPMPSVTGISPAVVAVGAGAMEILVSGRNFTAASEVLVNSAALPTGFVSAGELRATLPNQVSAASLPLQVRNPDEENEGQYLLSGSVNLVVEPATPPVVSFEPTPIAMPPDNRPHDITLRLSKPDVRDHTLNFSVSDPAKANVAPTSMTIAAGDVTAIVTITPHAAGSVTLNMTSATLGNTSVPMFLTQDFQGINTSYSLPVGVRMEGGAVPDSPLEMKPRSVIGIGVGAVLDRVAPGGWIAGSTLTLEVQGVAIPQGAQVSVLPSDGLTLGSAVVSEDGSRVSVAVTTAAEADIGPRRVIVRDANGSLLTFADATSSTVRIVAGLPRIDSVSPVVAVRGSTNTITVRGRNLHGARLKVMPSEALEVDAMPVVSADGTTLTADLHVAADAAIGARVVQVFNQAGASDPVAGANNTMQVVAAVESTYSWTAPIVGVTVGGLVPDSRTITPVLAQQLGLVVGAGATDVSPRVGIVGNTVNVTVSGQGLQDVSAVSLVPDGHISIGSPLVSGAGSQLSFSLDIAPQAETGLRRLVLMTPSGPMAFANVNDGSFLVSTPAPSVDSISPALLAVGGEATTLSVRGHYLRNVSDVRFEPADGITVIRPFVVDADGTLLQFAVQVDAGATTGQRKMIVTTAAGDSSIEASSSNTVTLAAQLGATYPDIMAPVVGVRIGGGGGASHDGALVSPLVGIVVVETPLPPTLVDVVPVSTQVGLVVGGYARSLSVDGWLQGTSGTLEVSGNGLDQVISVEAMPSDGILFSQVSVDPAGKLLSVEASVAQDAQTGSRRLRLLTGDGELAWAPTRAALFGIGRIPTMHSTTPIVLNTGETVELTVRGDDLDSVTGALFGGAPGITVLEPPRWSEDALGGLLKIRVRVDSNASPGAYVLQLKVPGGVTSANSGVENTVNVVASP